MTALDVAALVIAGVLAGAGLRSLLRWARTDLDSTSIADHILYAVYRTARVGMWFALAILFVAYASVDEPHSLRWYVLVPIGLASLQLVAGMALSRAGGGRGSAAR